MDSEALIKEMQKAMVNLCNYDESRVLALLMIQHPSLKVII